MSILFYENAILFNRKMEFKNKGFFPSIRNVLSVLSVDLEAIQILKSLAEISFLAAVYVRFPKENFLCHLCWHRRTAIFICPFFGLQRRMVAPS